MPITYNSIQHIPYKVGGIQVANSVGSPPPVGYTGPVKYPNLHTLYPTLSGRFNQNVAAPGALDARANITGAQSNTGDAFFLKYFDDEVTSIRLPCPAPVGVNLFVTDNLSGCKFYVDRINGSNDLIVYHANTHQHTGGAMANADFQRPQANAVLDGLHTAAQGDYAPLVLNNVAQCAMPVYFHEAGNLERRKQLQGRTDAHGGPGTLPKFMGGCTIVGFPTGPTWQFYYQAWGEVSYARPSGVFAVAKSLVTFHWKHLDKLRKEGRVHAPGYADMKVVDYGLIF